MRWKIENFANRVEDGGYLRITFDGKRVVDAFPWAKGPPPSDPAWVKQQVQRIIDAMNAIDQESE